MTKSKEQIICPVCLKEIGAGQDRFMQAKDRPVYENIYYHRECVTCPICNRLALLDEYVVREARLHHSSCLEGGDHDAATTGEEET